MRFQGLLLALVSLLFVSPLAGAGEVVRDVTALRRAAAMARPGDRIELAGGAWPGGLHLTGLTGAPGRSIVVAAADPENPPVFEGGTTGLHLTDPAWVVLEDLVFAGATGNGVNVDDGGSWDTPAHDVVLRRLEIRDVGPTGNRDGIKLSGVRGFLVEDCRILRWGSRGSGIDLVGCHDGVIRGCLFRHGDAVGNNGVQAKGGTADVLVERCRFEHAGTRAVQLGGSTGRPYFRPPLAASGNAEARRVEVRGCEFVGSQAAIAWASSEDCVVSRCTIYRPTRWVFRILQETVADDFVPCRRGVLEDTIVVWRRGDLHRHANIGSDTEPDTFRFEGNWWFCEDAHAASRPDLPAAAVRQTTGRDPRLRDPENGDLASRRDSPARGKGAGAYEPRGEREEDR